MRGAREAPAPRDSLNFRRTSLLSRNEYESGTFIIVLHATSSFTYVSVIYGANFSFILSLGLTADSPTASTCRVLSVLCCICGKLSTRIYAQPGCSTLVSFGAITDDILSLHCVFNYHTSIAITKFVFE